MPQPATNQRHLLQPSTIDVTLTNLAGFSRGGPASLAAVPTFGGGPEDVADLPTFGDGPASAATLARLLPRRPSVLGGVANLRWLANFRWRPRRRRKLSGSLVRRLRSGHSGRTRHGLVDHTGTLCGNLSGMRGTLGFLLDLVPSCRCRRRARARFRQWRSELY